MAGYLLGLGDRHPSNLMINRTSGRVVHIDYGDMFEVAMLRDRYVGKEGGAAVALACRCGC